MRFTRNLITAAILMQAASVYAANVPDAGQSIRMLEPENRYRPSDFNVQLQPSAVDRKAPVKPGGTAIKVNQFIIDGNTVISSVLLSRIVSPYQGKELTIGEIQGVADSISEYYHQQGFFLAKAYLPRQEIGEGKVTIQVLEGRYDHIGFNNASDSSDATIQRYLSHVHTDDVVKRDVLERQMLLISDLPAVEVKSTLKPGTRVGTTSLEVDTKSSSRVSGYFDSDNYGNKYTGTNRFGLTLNVNNPLGIGDQLSTRVMTSEAQQKYSRIAYQAPIGASGLQLGASYSEMNYRLGEEFSDFDAKGNSRITSAYGLYPLLRTRQSNISASLQFDNTVLKDDVDLFDSKSKKTINSWTLGFNGSSYDDFMGGGLNSFAVNYQTGILNIQSDDVKFIDNLSAKSDGHFTKLDGMVSRTQRVTNKLNLTGKISGQIADNNLDSSVKFDVGGSQGVRAFKQGDSSGDTGWLANLDLRYSVTENVVVNTFYDYGEVTYSRKAWDSSKNKATRSGAGVGLDVFGANWKVSMVGAWNTGGKPDSSEEGRQFWVQLLKAF